MEDESRPQCGKNTYPSVREFTKQTRQLLREEEKYEIELFEEMTKHKSIGEIEALGYGLAAMSVVATKRGFYGKDILTLTKSYHSEKNPLLLPEHCKIQVGDDVALFKNNAMVVDGVVSKRTGSKLQVTIRKEIDDDNDFEGLVCSVVLKWNEVTFRRYFRIMDELDQSQSALLTVFFQPNPPPAARYTRKMDYENPKLNEEQNEAVGHCLKETVHLLHGPPGTGKTTTVCELIVEAVKRKEKVLACGPSNIAVDNIVEGLSRRVNCVRVGNPARMIEGVIENCLDYQIAQKSATWKGEVKKLQSARKRLGKASRDEKRGIYSEIKQLRDEIFHLQQQAIQEILDDVDVICCTNVGAYDRIFRKYLPKRVFDLVVIDECGQSLEIACWIPILKGRRVVLAGDHKQLPPTIKGNESSLLGYTLFSRAMEELANITSTMLKVQYRMNNAIMGWSNKCFYENKLKAHSSV
jgi:ATP-dependent RNA/DNA helicase IGHMBP2